MPRLRIVSSTNAALVGTLRRRIPPAHLRLVGDERAQDTVATAPGVGACDLSADPIDGQTATLPFRPRPIEPDEVDTKESR